MVNASHCQSEVNKRSLVLRLKCVTAQRRQIGQSTRGRKGGKEITNALLVHLSNSFLVGGGGVGLGARLFEARRSTFPFYGMGDYSRWLLIRGWAANRVNTVNRPHFLFEPSREGE